MTQNLGEVLHPYSTKKNHRISAIGDMNIDSSQNTSTAKELKNLLKEHNLKILPSPPTRVTLTSSTIIYHCYSNNSQDTLDMFKTTLSDHFGLILNTNTKLLKPHAVITKRKKK